MAKTSFDTNPVSLHALFKTGEDGKPNPLRDGPRRRIELIEAD